MYFRYTGFVEISSTSGLTFPMGRSTWASQPGFTGWASSSLDTNLAFWAVTVIAFRANVQCCSDRSLRSQTNKTIRALLFCYLETLTTMVTWSKSDFTLDSLGSLYKKET